MVTDVDSVWIKKCLSGDKNAYTKLFEKYQKPIFNLVIRMVHNYETAQDVTQNVFVKAYQKLDTYNPRYRFFSWIYRIAINESLNFLKQKHSTSIKKPILAESKNPEEVMLESELNIQIQDALQKLSPQYRAIIILKHLQHFSYQEIAYITGISDQKVKSRLFTARHLLKEVLVEKGVLQYEA